MKAVVQRVKTASVTVNGKVTGRIARGLLVYLGVAAGDTAKDAGWISDKIANLRIFEDAEGKMNCSIKEVIAALNSEEASSGAHDGESIGILAVSQFTLLADAYKGRRPYYGAAAEPREAETLYSYFMQKIREQGLVCEAGVFRTSMEVACVNDGPVTILLDTRDL
ncbi:MAG: D-tyrosyl-tRNA(Tyr) deacylase [Treponema sp.]|jgi:D-tyrosyl-tRNA(Tyr) deacylase|nr:D-tyrosyl-tRNA(Tyr) deacylase [Treponema sp.]